METDYQKMYLEEKVKSLRMEGEALQLRFVQLQGEFPIAVKALEDYMKDSEEE